jgi:hypothetical protein
MRFQLVFLFDLAACRQYVPARPCLERCAPCRGHRTVCWRIHRKIGVSGGLFANQLETGLEIRSERVERLRQAHAAA